MFVRNRLNSGEYVTVVPQGLPITLQYDDNSRIEKVYVGYEVDAEYASEKLLARVIERNSVPRTVPLQNGTTWVYGVLYTGEPVLTTGAFPRGQVNAYLNMYLNSDDIQFNFFAATMKTLAGTFSGAVQISQWLSLAQFAKLPGISIVKDTYELDTHLWESLDLFPFRYPLIMGYFANKSGELSFHTTGLSQCTVDSITQTVDAVGRVSMLVSTSDGTLRYVTCQEYLKFNIQKGSTLVFTADNVVVYTYNDDAAKPVSSLLYCTTCGRQIPISNDGVIMCPDIHCVSRLYPRIEQFLSTLGLPKISYTDYKNFSSPTHGAFSIVDILDYPAIESVNVSTTLHQLLRSIVPTNIVPITSHLLDNLCTNCNNSTHTLTYYMHNPQLIVTELELEDARSLVHWFEDPVNVSDVESLFNHSRISITLQDKKFDGPPIFRGKVVYITGTFLHGGPQEVSAIISSYGAEVVTEYNENVHCVVVGDSHEDIAGYAIQSALKHRIPVMTESEFFQRYQIDDDLASNL